MESNKILLSILFILIPLLFQTTNSCTDFGYPVNNAVFSARTMDFMLPQDNMIVPVTIGTKFVSLSPYNNTIGTTWISTLGYISFTAYGMNHTAEGMNECGLSCSLLTLMETEFQTVPGDKTNQALQASLFCDYILGQFCNVQDVQTNVSKLYVYRDMLIGNVPMPLTHMSIRDENNNAIVLEFIKGQQIFYDNLISILTNDPCYPYHLLSVRNYDYLSNLVVPNKIVINNLEYTSYSSFTSVPNFGVSWDDSPVSRFVRISQAVRFMTPASNINYALSKGYHLLNKVEVMPDITIYETSEIPGGLMYDMTLYKVIRDHTNRRIFFATYFDPTLRLIELTNINFYQTNKVIHLADPNEFCTSVNITGLFA